MTSETVLKCPRDETVLNIGKEHGIEVDRCPTCEGAWFEDEELEALESTVAEDHHRSGMIDYAKRDSHLKCPVCGQEMMSFNYRAYNLELEACTEEHGFWLDAGDASRVREVMQERVAGLERAGKAEQAWYRAKRGSNGILDQLRDRFRRR